MVLGCSTPVFQAMFYGILSTDLDSNSIKLNNNVNNNKSLNNNDLTTSLSNEQNLKKKNFDGNNVEEKMKLENKEKVTPSLLEDSK